MTINAAGTLILANTGRVLLLKRADGEGWDQPGGMSEPDDDDPSTTAIRELDEETGFSAALLDCIDSFTIRRLRDGRLVTYMPRAPERAELEYALFVCTFREEFVPALTSEHTDWGWFEVDEPPEDIHPGTGLALKVLVKKGF